MKKSLLLLVLLVVPCLAQNPVEEAKTKIAKQKHDAIVQHAKDLLERKEELEKELAEIDAKLAKLANGEDVKQPSIQFAGTGTITSTNLALSYTPTYCVNGSGAVVSCPQ